jgi:hypothetical protein
LPAGRWVDYTGADPCGFLLGEVLLAACTDVPELELGDAVMEETRELGQCDLGHAGDAVRRLLLFSARNRPRAASCGR